MAAKAAIMIKQMTDSLGEVDYVCYWHASDIFAGDFDAKRILNGACGLTVQTDFVSHLICITFLQTIIQLSG